MRTHAQVQKQIDNAVEQLAAALEAGESQQLRRYLAVMGRFHHYSLGNALLIAMQRPGARQVAGFHTWRRLGRQVRRGERGIRILAPVTRHEPVADDPEDERRVRSVVVGYRTVCVFDVSQTDGNALPELNRARGRAKEQLQRLTCWLASRGVRIEAMPRHSSALGASTGGRVLVREDLPEAERFAVLAHEAAHELLHHEGTRPESRKVREVEAEAVAFAVCQGVGLEARAAAADYIQLYRGDKPTLLASLTRIRQAAAAILGGMATAAPPQPRTAQPVRAAA